MEQDIRCVNCEDVFAEIRPRITEVYVSKHFHRDLPDFNTSLVLDSQHKYFRHLHKLEDHFGGIFVFRALKEHTHIVYAVFENKLVFLRAFHNFKEYKRFLEDRKEIKHLTGSFL